MGTVVTSNGKGHTVVVDRARNVATVRASTAPVRVQDNATAAALRDRTQVLAVAAPGPQGPRGVQGPPGPPGAAVVQRVAAQALGGHRIVRSAGGGAVDYASSADPTHGDDTLGLTQGAAAAGGTVLVQTTGSIEHGGWTWVPGEPVFLGTDGLPTQTAPTSGVVQQIGHAESETSLFIAVQPPIFIED